MSAGSPYMGYPSRTAAVVALRKDGKRTSEIAGMMGVSPSTVRSLAKGAAARTGAPRGRPKPAKAPAASPPLFRLPEAATIDGLPETQRKRMRAHAARRGLSVPGLLQRIMDKVVEDNLVDAVLDDADDLRKWG